MAPKRHMFFDRSMRHMSSTPSASKNRRRFSDGKIRSKAVVSSALGGCNAQSLPPSLSLNSSRFTFKHNHRAEDVKEILHHLRFFVRLRVILFVKCQGLKEDINAAALAQFIPV